MKSIIAVIFSLLLSIACWAAEAVNINTATAEQLAESLKGVGLAKAEAIVKYRDANGGFKHIDELVNVKGIGLRTVDMNRDYIQLQGKPTAKTKK